MSTPPSAPRIIRKSIAYITQRGRILFFRADEAPDQGAELPGGTLHPAEDPVEGLRREILEETGFADIGTPHLLGVVEFDPGSELNEVHHRHFYHVALEATAPETWSRIVEEGNGTFTFRFFWAAPDALPSKVYPGHDVFVAEVGGLLEGALWEDAQPDG